MAKKTFIIFTLTLLLVSSFAVNGYCETAVKKLGRGVCNVITSPLEIPNQMGRIGDREGPMAGVTYGLLKGIVMTGVRAVVGVYEIVSFPVPYPSYYGPVLKDPEFFFEEESW